MDDDNTENQDSLNLDEELDLEKTDEVDVEQLKETNKKLFARAKKAEGFVQDPATGKWVKPQKRQTTSTEITNSERSKPDFDKDEYGELRFDGYTKEEAEFILRNGGRKALEDKNSHVSIAINTKREQAKAETAADQTQDTSQMSEAERKFTPEQMKNMTAKELEGILPHA